MTLFLFFPVGICVVFGKVTFTCSYSKTLLYELHITMWSITKQCVV